MIADLDIALLKVFTVHKRKLWNVNLTEFCNFSKLKICNFPLKLADFFTWISCKFNRNDSKYFKSLILVKLPIKFQLIFKFAWKFRSAFKNIFAYWCCLTVSKIINLYITRNIHRVKKTSTATVVTYLDILVVVSTCIAGLLCGIFSVKYVRELNSRLNQVRSKKTLVQKASKSTFSHRLIILWTYTLQTKTHWTNKSVSSYCLQSFQSFQLLTVRKFDSAWILLQ